MTFHAQSRHSWYPKDRDGESQRHYGQTGTFVCDYPYILLRTWTPQTYQFIKSFLFPLHSGKYRSFDKLSLIFPYRPTTVVWAPALNRGKIRVNNVRWNNSWGLYLSAMQKKGRIGAMSNLHLWTRQSLQPSESGGTPVRHWNLLYEINLYD